MSDEHERSSDDDPSRPSPVARERQRIRISAALTLAREARSDIARLRLLLRGGEQQATPPSGAAATVERGPTRSSSHAAGERAIKNTSYRTGAEVIGRLASLLLFAVAGRTLGPSGLGAFVFAIAFLGFVILGVDIGLDRYLLRAIARERSAEHRLFYNVLALKLALAVPLFGGAFLVLHLLGYHHQAQVTAWALAPGVLADSLTRTQLSVFLAHERGGPPSVADAVNRVASAGLGIAALKAGYGVVSVAVTYSAGSLIGLAVGFVLLSRTIGLPTFGIAPRRWRALAARSVPFATQDSFSVLLARVGTLILAAIATQAAVGRFGAAYRLFESTLLITYALAGAFAAMFTYLGPDSDPPLRGVFQRAIKLALVALVPVGVAFAVLAEPICRVIYGASFSSAAEPLRILAPAVVCMGVVTLGNSLMVSRENPARMIPVAGTMAGANVVLNLILIPLYSDAGAAAAMLITELIYAAWVLRLATRTVGRIYWLTTAAGAAAGGAVMAAATLALQSSMWIALVVGGAAYLVTLLLVERVVSPHDAKFVADLVRLRLPSRSPG